MGLVRQFTPEPEPDRWSSSGFREGGGTGLMVWFLVRENRCLNWTKLNLDTTNSRILVHCWIELECLQKWWTSPIYAFFGPTPDIEYVAGRWCHVFQCCAKGCKQHIWHFLDKGDSGLTSNLYKHANSYWGEPAVTAVTSLSNIKDARNSVKGIKETGSITATFKKKGSGKIAYSHRQHTKTETKCTHCCISSDMPHVSFLMSCRAKIVCWVCKSLHPFKLVADWGFKVFMKMGRLEYYLPSHQQFLVM